MILSRFTSTLTKAFPRLPVFAVIIVALISVAILVAARPATLTSGPCTSPSFHGAPVYGVGPQPRDAKVGDFNNDGKLDIVTANYNGDSVSVLLNIGSGVFSNTTNFPAGDGPQAVAVGDFNSDGNKDLITSNVNNFSVSLLLGDGHGSFGAPLNFTVSGTAFDVATADFNNDGKLDVAVACGSSGLVSVLLGNGAGGFSAPRNSVAGQQAQSLAVGDFNGDGKADLAVANVVGLQILTGDGNGTFTALSPCLVVSASRVAAADLNGDGAIDLVTTWALSDEVTVLLNVGSGCFTAHSFKGSDRVGYHAESVQIGDLNSDGKPDLLIGTDNVGFTTFLGNGTGQFGPPRSFTEGQALTCSLADFDSDGKIDALALVGNDSVSVYLGDAQGGFVNLAGHYAAGMVSRDFNGDGLADLVASTGTDILVFLGNGSGRFQAIQDIAFRQESAAIAVGDFNKDGKLDLATLKYNGDYNVAILLNDGTGHFSGPTTFLIGYGASAIGVGDFNNDGNLDVVTAHQLYDQVNIVLGDGHGGFGAASHLSIPVGTNITSFGIADFNSDGNLDVAIPNFHGVQILAGDGHGSFNLTSTAAPGIASQADVAGDLNGDGKPDIALVNSNTNEMTVALGDGAGGFAAPKTYAVNGRPQSLTLGDFNLDGVVDVAVANNAPPPTGFGLSYVTVLLNDGNGNLGSPADYQIPNPTSVVAADVNKDGSSDLVVSGHNGVLTVLLNSCTAMAPEQTTLQFGAPNYIVNEGAGSVTVTVTRTGDASVASSIDYSTGDGTALQSSDYVLTAGTLHFNPGDVSKSFEILVVDDLIPVEGSESLSVTLSKPVGCAIGTPSTITMNIVDNDPTFLNVNPLDNADAQFFVRQQYYDFLNRSPDPDGFTFWTGQITQCGADANCIRNKRIDVSNAFFYELEYQQTGSYVYRLYRAAFGNNQPFPNPILDPSDPGEEKKVVSYDAFVGDRARVIGGSNLAQSQLDLANAFVLRPEFLAKYPASLDGPGFVDALLATIRSDIGVDLTSQRTALINLFNSGGRGAVIYRLADDNTQTNPINNRAFIDAEYDRAFVATQYFGYLRRDPDMAGYLFWLGQVSSAPLRDVPKQHAMVCSFVTSAEYQLRFSSIVTHNNSECPQ